jgi:hypothetical protein
VPAVAAASGTPAATPSPGARVSFDAPPGQMQLRLSVEGAGSEVLDSDTRELTVPDLSAAATLLGTPSFFRGRTVRDMQQLKINRDALPTAGREFQRTDRLLIRVPAYGPDGSVPAIVAKLLNRTGQPMSDVAVAAEGAEAVLELLLAPLPTGDYVLDISAAGTDVKQLVAFRITS